MSLEFLKSCYNYNSKEYKNQFHKYIELLTHSDGIIDDAMFDFSIYIIKHIENIEQSDKLTLYKYQEFINLLDLYTIGMKFALNKNIFHNMTYFKQLFTFNFMLFSEIDKNDVTLVRKNLSSFKHELNNTFKKIKENAYIILDNNDGSSLFDEIDLNKILNEALSVFEYTKNTELVNYLLYNQLFHINVDDVNREKMINLLKT
jgi:hypothetical protein